MTARVSVVLPVYNGAAHVEEAIRSLLGQTFREFELVVIDDGSTDETPDILARLAGEDSRVRVHTTANAGLVPALRRGIAESRCDLLARMDADDVSEPERLARQVAVLDAEPDVVLVTCDQRIIDEFGADVTTHEPSAREPLTDWFLHYWNVVGGHSQVMFRRDTYERAGGYREEELLAEDYALWTRMAGHGRIHFLPELLLRYRISMGGLSRSNQDAQVQRTVEVAERHRRENLGVRAEHELGVTLLRFWLAPKAFGLDWPDPGAAEELATHLRAAAAAWTRGRPDPVVTALHMTVAERFVVWARYMRSRAGVRAVLPLVREGARWHPGGWAAVAGLLGGQLRERSSSAVARLRGRGGGG